jgi:4-hydroxy-tetrahydrodipicolinate reductase
MVKLAVSGCCGRMGQRITALALKDKIFKVHTLLEGSGRLDLPMSLNGMAVHTDNKALKGANVLIEFTSPEATISNLKACQKHGVNMVIGTTGLTKPQIAQIKKASSKIAIVFSSNMSVGVNLVFALIGQAARITGKNYQMYLTETHHIHKKDAPSGTAITMAQVAEQYSKSKVKDIQSLREGEVIGDHTITFESPVDLISIHHHAKTRDIFAEGSLVAAKFVAKKKKGLYNMQDVLGLK